GARADEVASRARDGRTPFDVWTPRRGLHLISRRIVCPVRAHLSGNARVEPTHVSRVFVISKDVRSSWYEHAGFELQKFTDSFVGFRPFASVCSFCERNDTRNVTRRGRR